MFLDKTILILGNVFLLFRNYRYLPLEKDVTFHLNKLESPLPRDALCLLSLIEICPCSGSGEEDILIPSMCYIKTWDFIKLNLSLTTSLW